MKAHEEGVNAVGLKARMALDGERRRRGAGREGGDQPAKHSIYVGEYSRIAHAAAARYGMRERAHAAIYGSPDDVGYDVVMLAYRYVRSEPVIGAPAISALGDLIVKSIRVYMHVI